jgi:hypothetical protein
MLENHAALILRSNGGGNPAIKKLLLYNYLKVPA